MLPQTARTAHKRAALIAHLTLLQPCSECASGTTPPQAGAEAQRRAHPPRASQSPIRSTDPHRPWSMADADKVVVIFRAAGGAPILQQSKVKVTLDSKFSKLVLYLRKQLKSDSVFVYLREAFTPSLDDDLAVLKQAYGVDGKLHVNYAMTPAWG